MKIGIVGGGAAGLTSAWLLGDQHEVTLFEADDRLGGHAHTIEIETDGQRLEVDAGFQFFGAGRRTAGSTGCSTSWGSLARPTPRR